MFCAFHSAWPKLPHNGGEISTPKIRPVAGYLFSVGSSGHSFSWPFWPQCPRLLLLELLNYCDYIGPRIGQLHYFIPANLGPLTPIFHSVTVFPRIQCHRYEATRRQLLRTWCFQTRQADKSGALRLRQTPELDELAPTPSVVEWNIRMSKMFFLTCCERTMEWIFIPSQSRSWRRVCWGAKHRKHLKSSSMITYRLLWIAQIAHLDAQCLYGVLGAWIGSRPCRLEMRLVWSLDRNVATAMKARKLPVIIGGFKKHTRWKGNIRLSEVSGHKCRPRLYTSGQSYLPRV